MGRSTAGYGRGSEKIPYDRKIMIPHSGGKVRILPGRESSPRRPPGFFASCCDICFKLLMTIILFMSVFGAISSGWDWWGSRLPDKPIDDATASSSFQKVTSLFEQPVAVDTGSSTSEKSPESEFGWPSYEAPEWPPSSYEEPTISTEEPFAHHRLAPQSPEITSAPFLEGHCHFNPILGVSHTQLHTSSLFPIDGIPMSNDHDIFAHLINTGLTIYRAPIFNLPLIRSRLLPQALIVESLVGSHALRQGLVSSSKSNKEADNVKKSLRDFMKTLPGLVFGVKVQRYDAELVKELEALKATMMNGTETAKSSWMSTFWAKPKTREDEVMAEELRVLKKIYDTTGLYHRLLTTSIEKHKQYLKHVSEYLQYLQRVKDSGGNARSYKVHERSINAFSELSESMMLGLRAREQRLRLVLDQKRDVIKKFKGAMEGGGRALKCEGLSLDNLIGWVQHSFMVERRYHEGFF